MQFVIEDGIFEKFPEVAIGALVVRGIDNTGESERITNLLAEESERIRRGYSYDALNDDPKILAWREAYRAFGAKPKKNRCSVENLYRMVLDGINLRPINKLVDIYNYLSLKYTVPVGGDDLPKIAGDLRLTIAEGNERFVQLNNDEVSHPKGGEVVYRDDEDVLCRRWNWRECDKSKMTAETTDALLVVEGLPPMSRDDVEKIVTEMGQLVSEVCGGEVRHFVLDTNTRSADV